MLNADGLPKRPDESCMTQAELGERLEPRVSQSTIARWEAGRMEPRRKYKPQLAAALSADVRMLFPMIRGVA